MFRLTQYMQQINHDEHLWVRFHPEPLPEGEEALRLDPDFTLALVGMAAEDASRQQMREIGSMNDMLMERLSAMLDIRLLGATERAAHDFETRAESLRENFVPNDVRMEAKNDRLLIITGLGLLAIGVLLHFAPGLFHWFGRLPGDIRVERENGVFFVPITSMSWSALIRSTVLSTFSLWAWAVSTTITSTEPLRTRGWFEAMAKPARSIGVSEVSVTSRRSFRSPAL